jgi:L,D-transpeptidase catalytic domain
MNLTIKSAATAAFIITSLLIPIMMIGETTGKFNNRVLYKAVYHVKSSAKNRGTKNDLSIPTSWSARVLKEADSVYKRLELVQNGLSKKAFLFAWKGYRLLMKKGILQRSDVLSICDFSQSSRHKRLYIIDVEERKLLLNTYVAHGRNSGGEFARKFSNRPESHQSSLGFYITRQTYLGEHGLSLKIEGLERGFNDRANARNIVVHGSDYIGPDFLDNNKFSGRSYGCPAVPFSESELVIDAIKNGSCLFIYHPTQKYITKSKIINS